MLMKIYNCMGVGANEFHRDWGQRSFTEIVLHIRYTYLVGREKQRKRLENLKKKKNAFFFSRSKYQYAVRKFFWSMVKTCLPSLPTLPRIPSCMLFNISTKLLRVFTVFYFPNICRTGGKGIRTKKKFSGIISLIRSQVMTVFKNQVKVKDFKQRKRVQKL